MVFIEGVGYVNDSSAVATPNHTQSVSETTANFDGMLRTETDKLNQASVTTNLDSIFKEAADKYGVSERLLKAIAYTESGFQADVTSFSGAMGIMQLMPSTASAYGVSDPYDAYQNIMGGAAVLKDLLNMFQGNQSLAIAGYNAGCGNVKKYGGVPPFTETQNYVAKVTSLMQTGVSVPANTVTVNPSANTSSNTGTATSENFNTSNEATVSSETAKKKCGNPRRDQRDHLCHFHTHNEPKHVFKYIHAEWSFRIKRNIRFRFQCRQPAFLLWESDLYDSVILTECRYNGHGQPAESSILRRVPVTHQPLHKHG